MLKKIQWYVLLRILLLAVTIGVALYCLLQGWYVYSVVALTGIIFAVISLYNSQVKAYRELSEFVESIRYRDFSRHFNSRNTSSEIQLLRTGFNEINGMFKTVSLEKETQYQYLQKILELVDTGILSYETETGKVKWMNESLKKLLRLPYLKTIHSFARRDNNLYKEILSLKPGESKVATLYIERSLYKIFLSATAFQTADEKFKLVAFQNINEAVDETESKAWQKLLSVLTHEIMNSIAPISSLADTLKNRLKSVDRAVQTSIVFDDIELGIDTIKRRSEGLLKFAETYRNLNKISEPNLSDIYVRDLFENLQNLLQPMLSQKNIELEITLRDPGLMLKADANLVEQVLINLLVNAMEAVKETNIPRISLSAITTDNGKTLLKVTDNGTGMSEEVLDKIFIPFFSTKKTGSGIGLTLCRQIMMLHHGNLQVQSREGEGSSFLMQF
ncbi:MAG: HAMP domain-containing histidine kinase [Flavobacterium sp.]|nr:HAMP domain-containing histidine kinase [Pedobacter sp.]